MRWISNILREARKSCFGREITSTFDTYNAEANEIVTPQTCSGVKTEVSKTLAPFLQVSRVDILDRNAHTSQMFGTLSLKNTLVQVSMDHENSVGFRAMNMSGNLITKIHTIITGRKEVFSQVELEMKNRINNFGLKLISPAVKSTGMVYVANTLHQFGSLSLGGEVIGADSELGVSVCGRYEHRNGVFSVGLQQFTALSLNYYHKLGKYLDVGTEVQIPKSCPPSAAVGCRLTTSKTQMKANVNSDMSLSFCLGEKLTEGLSFNVNAEVNKSGCTHGFGFSLEF
ncbi:translocase of outer mitochondrial membrane 40-like protein [Encephalitozoon intestinalis ATCC 50506]|uniref:Translocase of outer mitochondrial membrane 40-like protein n=1 Tax=Encephalitozoon intestinalis (strain ATCC 50506) TaxID=876142 RepID=E0S7G9_ENCIT|nr:translocase of outer mitochondrial membrane 40-like protein [Encephalitozoon intestinalis ATCC 50506]ADM11648.1 translocase of outer mitochondrial membrane 40-like protein [Encephalitozoon intestinalis ATCC 50506]UTX45382.1 translocase of outer mitochondrial membrane 40-like protein [Encephalitozoon intestinalis]